MKKLIVFISIILLSFSLFAIDTSITLGYQTKNTDGYAHDPYYISIDIWQNFDKLCIYGSYTNEMAKSKNSWMFSPSQDYFIVGVSYDFGIMKLSAEHMCQHPVISNYTWDGIQGGYTRFEITLGD